MSGIYTRIYQFARGLIISNRRTVVTVLHVGEAAAANYLAFLVRFESALTAEHISLFLKFLPALIIIRLVFYLQGGLYKNLWRYASVGDLLRILKTVTLGTAAFVIVVRYIFGEAGYPRSIYIIDWLLLIMLSGGARLFIRVFREYMQDEYTGRRVLVIGAGDAGEMVVRDMRNNPSSGYEPVAFIDDDPYKKGLTLHGVPIEGPRAFIESAVGKYAPDEILIAMPSASQETIRAIFDECKGYNIPIKILPRIADIISGRVSADQIKPLQLEDLLHREPVRTDIASVRRFVFGKSVLITGAGGSIGSELSRQIAGYRPKSLALLDRHENGLYSIDLELRARFPELPIHAVIGDILDPGRLAAVFAEHSPEIVFHAAAHKHVPLMEHNPLEAVKNNIFGTMNLIEASAKHRVGNFVLISTDKAVNPANIMGATKRVAEFLTIGQEPSDTRFSVVRFGNVLGSSGSVVPLFRKQIQDGGPVTVTHPDIKRYFMLIPEAVQLVLVAASEGEGGGIYVLEMGEQVKIAELAENLIRLSGFVPNEDIKIVFTGLRPGEKLFEELFDRDEEMIPSRIEKLRMARPKPIGKEALASAIEELKSIAERNAQEEVESALKKIIPGFRTASSDRP